MARLLVLALLVATAASASATRSWLRLADDPEPAVSCVKITTGDACATADGCSWCTNSVIGDIGCLPDALAAKMSQAKLAECTGMPAPSADELTRKKHRHDDKPKPKPPATCGDNKEKRDCLHLGAEEGDCAWCDGGFMPASCLTAQAAKFLPEMVATCKAQKPKKGGKHAAEALREDAGGDDPPAPEPKPPVSCGDNKDKHACLHLGAEEGECAWCAGDFMPASCVGLKAAEWVPEQVAKCKKGHSKKADVESEDTSLTAADELERKHRKKRHDDDDDDDDDSGSGGGFPGGGWVPGGSGGSGWWPGGSGSGKKKHDKKGGSGGGFIPGGGSWGPGGGDFGPGGKGGAGGVGCMSLKTRKHCLRADEGCAWCPGSFLGSSCVSGQTAKFIPSMVSSCEMPRDKKHGGKKDEAVATS